MALLIESPFYCTPPPPPVIPVKEGFQLCMFQGLTDLEMADFGKLQRITIGLRSLLIKINNHNLKLVVSEVSYIGICLSDEALILPNSVHHINLNIHAFFTNSHIVGCAFMWYSSNKRPRGSARMVKATTVNF